MADLTIEQQSAIVGVDTNPDLNGIVPYGLNGGDRFTTLGAIAAQQAILTAMIEAIPFTVDGDGVYDPARTYQRFSLVRYTPTAGVNAGVTGTYWQISTGPVTGVAPDDTATWFLWSQDGGDGESSSTSIQSFTQPDEGMTVVAMVGASGGLSDDMLVTTGGNTYRLTNRPSPITVTLLNLASHSDTQAIAPGATVPAGKLTATGQRGQGGLAATIEVTDTNTVAPGAPASFTENTGSTAQARDYTANIPQGVPGNAATIQVSDTNTVAPGVPASFTEDSGSTAQARSYTANIPQGADGVTPAIPYSISPAIAANPGEIRFNAGSLSVHVSDGNGANHASTYWAIANLAPGSIVILTNKDNPAQQQVLTTTGSFSGDPVRTAAATSSGTAIANGVEVVVLVVPAGPPGPPGTGSQINVSNADDSVSLSGITEISFENAADTVVQDGTVARVTTAGSGGGSVEPSSTLVAYWEFEGDAVDSIDAITLANSNVTFLAGQNGNAATFNGTTSELTDPISSALSFGPKDYSIGFWVNLGSLAGTQVFVSMDDGGSPLRRVFSIFKSSTNILAALVGDGSTGFETLVSSFTFSVATYVHVVFTHDFDNKVIQLYANGSIVGSLTYALTHANPGGVNMVVGNRFGGSDLFLDGQVDQLFVTDGVISQAQITQIAAGVSDVAAVLAGNTGSGGGGSIFTEGSYTTGDRTSLITVTLSTAIDAVNVEPASRLVEGSGSGFSLSAAVANAEDEFIRFEMATAQSFNAIVWGGDRGFVAGAKWIWEGSNDGTTYTLVSESRVLERDVSSTFAISGETNEIIWLVPSSAAYTFWRIRAITAGPFRNVVRYGFVRFYS